MPDKIWHLAKFGPHRNSSKIKEPLQLYNLSRIYN